jgi:hypothetical protein
MYTLTFESESAATDVTGKRLGVVVHMHVTMKIVQPTKLFACNMRHLPHNQQLKKKLIRTKINKSIYIKTKG